MRPDHPNAAAIQRFYEAFQRLDGPAMAPLYHPSARFSDPAFPGLVGPEVPGMWAMLCEAAQDFELTFSGVQADDEAGEARWEAHYTFGPTGRRVHNVVHAHFRFEGAQVTEHRDDFDFGRWARQALGLPGLLFGWSGFLQKTVQGQALKGLKKFMKSAAPQDAAAS